MVDVGFAFYGGGGEGGGCGGGEAGAFGAGHSEDRYCVVRFRE